MERRTVQLVPLLQVTPQQRRSGWAPLLAHVVGPQDRVAFADDAMWCPEAFGPTTVWPFPEEAGCFAGLPVDDDDAVAALEQATAAGLDHLGFPAASIWWLTTYPRLADILARGWVRTVDTVDLVLSRQPPRGS